MSCFFLSSSAVHFEPGFDSKTHQPIFVSPGGKLIECFAALRRRELALLLGREAFVHRAEAGAQARGARDHRRGVLLVELGARDVVLHHEERHVCVFFCAREGYSDGETKRELRSRA